MTNTQSTQSWELQQGMVITKNSDGRNFTVQVIRIGTYHVTGELDISVDLQPVAEPEVVLEFIPIDTNFFLRFSPAPDYS